MNTAQVAREAQKRYIHNIIKRMHRMVCSQGYKDGDVVVLLRLKYDAEEIKRTVEQMVAL